MPVDFVAVRAQVNGLGAEARQRQQTLAERRLQARQWLEQYAAQADFLHQRVEAVKAHDAHVRCAVPDVGALTARHAAPAAAPDVVVIAADGSQVNPDRHAAVPFGVVNAAAVVMKPGSGEAPARRVESELLYGEEAESETGLLSEALVALRRDLKERALLEDVAKDAAGPVVTLTDGPLELWGAKGEDPRLFEQALQSYLGVLSRLQSRGVTTAGYVDKPGADLVVRLLELAGAAEAELKEPRQIRSLRGVSDRWLFGDGNTDFQLLAPGERSAVFALQSGSQEHFRGALALHFFYLNVGDTGHPHPVRVEIPAWVAEDEAQVALLHAVLLEQCRIMGVRPYPYILHRAHEEALVKRDEAQQIEHMLADEMRRQGVSVDEISAKQSAKDLAGRTGYGSRGA